MQNSENSILKTKLIINMYKVINESVHVINNLRIAEKLF